MIRALLLALLIAVPATAKESSISELFKKVADSVVVIKTEESGVGALPGARATSIGGLGSGVLISDDGLVLTASHVVQVANEVSVEFPSGERIAARVVGSQPAADIALLQLDHPPARRHVVAELGDSDIAAVGEQIFIVGAPLGISHTLTVGHVSAKRSMHLTLSNFEDGELIQTDAAINQGNSGGPMFDMHGRVIGIVSHMITESGGYEGLGFAIASNVAREQLLERPTLWSGLDGMLVEGAWASIFNIPAPGVGMLVQRVADDSLASALGLRGGLISVEIEGQELILGGDIILSVEGLSLAAPDADTAIPARLAEIGEGKPVRVRVLRAGETIELEASLPAR